MVEVWKAIPGYEGIYEVSDQGNVRSLDRYVYRPTLLWGQAAMTFCEGRELKQVRNKKGYLEVCLSNGCKKTAKRFRVHRLVAMAFIPNPDNLPQINHKDEDKTNNQVCNLEWCNRRYNACYGSKLNRTKNTCIRNNIYSKILDKRDELGSYGARKKVAMCDIDGNILKVFPSMSEASREIGVNVGKICECCQGKRTKTRNYKWKYYGEN